MALQYTRGEDIRLQWSTADETGAAITLTSVLICLTKLESYPEYEFDQTDVECTITAGFVDLVIPGATTAAYPAGRYQIVFKGTSSGGDIDILDPFPILTIIENPCV
jgi:hypothetical protein